MGGTHPRVRVYISFNYKKRNMIELFDGYRTGTLDLYLKYNSLDRIKEEIDKLDKLLPHMTPGMEEKSYYLRGIKDYLYPRIKAMCYVGIDTEVGHTIGDILKVTFKYVPDPMLFLELVVPSIERTEMHNYTTYVMGENGFARAAFDTYQTEVRHSGFLGWFIKNGDMDDFDLPLLVVMLSSPIMKKLGALEQYKEFYEQDMKELKKKAVGNDDVNQSLKALKDNIKREIRDTLREAKKLNLNDYDKESLQKYKEQSRKGNIHELYTTLVDIKTVTLRIKNFR